MRLGLISILLCWLSCAFAPAVHAAARSDDIVLRVIYKSTGERTATLTLSDSQARELAVDSILALCVGVNASEVMRESTLEPGRFGWRVSSRLSRTLTLGYTDEIRLTPLEALRALAPESSVRVEMRLPESPLVRGELPITTRGLGIVWLGETIPPETALSVISIHFGWNVSGVVFELAALIVPLFLVLLGVRMWLCRVRRVCEARDESEIFVQARLLFWGTVIGWVFWAVYVGLQAPLGFVGYLWPETADHYLFLTTVFMGGSATCVTLAVWLQFHRVLDDFALASWTREAFVYQCLVSCVTIFLIQQVFLSQAFFGFSYGTDTVAPELGILVLGSGAFWILLCRRPRLSGGIITRELPCGPTQEQIHRLAQSLNIKRIPHCLGVHFSGGFLPVAFVPINPFDTSSLRLDARFLSTASAVEQDGYIAGTLIHWKRSHKSWLDTTYAAYLVLGIIAVSGVVVFGLVNETAGFNWPAFLAISCCVALLIGLLGRAHYAWIARRQIRATDEAVLDLLGDPNAQVRGVVREALLHLEPFRVDACSWLRATVPVEERAARIAPGTDVAAVRMDVVRELESEEEIGSEQRIPFDVMGELSRRAMFAMGMLTLLLIGPMVPLVLQRILYPMVLPLELLLPVLVLTIIVVVVAGASCFVTSSFRKVETALAARLMLPEDALILAAVEYRERALGAHLSKATLPAPAFLCCQGNLLVLQSEVERLELAPSTMVDLKVRVRSVLFVPGMSLELAFRRNDADDITIYECIPIGAATLRQQHEQTKRVYQELRAWLEDGGVEVRTLLPGLGDSRVDVVLLRIQGFLGRAAIALLLSVLLGVFFVGASRGTSDPAAPSLWMAGASWIGSILGLTAYHYYRKRQILWGAD